MTSIQLDTGGGGGGGGGGSYVPPMSRAKAAGVTYWGLPGVAVGFITASNVLVGANTMYSAAILVTRPITVVGVAASVQAAAVGGLVRLGIYKADDDLQPTGAPVLDAGEIDCSTTGLKTITGLSASLAGGAHLIAALCNNAGVAFHMTNGMSPGLAPGLRDIDLTQQIQSMTAAQAYGALPASAPAWSPGWANSAARYPFVLRYNFT